MRIFNNIPAGPSTNRLYNHGEGPYQGLLLVESAYQRFHIEDTIKTLCLIVQPVVEPMDRFAALKQSLSPAHAELLLGLIQLIVIASQAETLQISGYLDTLHCRYLDIQTHCTVDIYISRHATTHSLYCIVSTYQTAKYTQTPHCRYQISGYRSAEC